MSDLAKVVALCKCGVHVEINGHRDYYDTAEEEIECRESRGLIHPGDLEPEVRAEMIRTDTIVHVQAYPLTPIGFYSVYHYDLGVAINEMVSALTANE